MNEDPAPKSLYLNSSTPTQEAKNHWAQGRPGLDTLKQMAETRTQYQCPLPWAPATLSVHETCHCAWLEQPVSSKYPAGGEEAGRDLDPRVLHGPISTTN